MTPADIALIVVRMLVELAPGALAIITGDASDEAAIASAKARLAALPALAPRLARLADKRRAEIAAEAERDARGDEVTRETAISPTTAVIINGRTVEVRGVTLDFGLVLSLANHVGNVMPTVTWRSAAGAGVMGRNDAVRVLPSLVLNVARTDGA